MRASQSTTKRWLREQGYRYLVVSRERARQFEAESALPIENAAGKTVSIQRVDDVDNQEVRLYCYSEQRTQKEDWIVLDKTTTSRYPACKRPWCDYHCFA